MARRVLYRERSEQPAVLTNIDWGNPITRGLISLIDGASRRDLVQANTPTSYTGVQLGGTAGLAMNYTTGQFATFPFAQRSRITNQLTVFSYTDYTASGSPNGFIFGDTEASGAGYNFGLYSNGTVWNSFVKTGGTGVSASGGTFGIRSRFRHAFTYDGANIRQYLDGVAAGVTARTGNVDQGSFSLNINRWNSTSVHAGRHFYGAIWNRALTPAEIASLSANPWQLFEPQTRSINIAASVSVYRPGSDVTVNGWIATPGGSLASCIDDPTLDRADFITSPDLSSPTTLAWANPLPTGTWDVSVDGVRVGTAGQVRVVCLDAGGTSVGNTSWQVLTGTDTTYTLPVTTTATSTQFRIEVQ